MFMQTPRLPSHQATVPAPPKLSFSAEVRRLQAVGFLTNKSALYPISSFLQKTAANRMRLAQERLEHFSEECTFQPKTNDRIQRQLIKKLLATELSEDLGDEIFASQE